VRAKASDGRDLHDRDRGGWWIELGEEEPGVHAGAPVAIPVYETAATIRYKNVLVRGRSRG
jgi:hypothetical protein